MDDLVPPSFERHTVVLLLRPSNPPVFGEEELDRLQVEHLAYLRDLGRRGVLVANGPFDAPSDERYRGMSVYRVAPAEARALAEADPIVRAGRLTIEVMSWMTAQGAVRFPGTAWPRSALDPEAGP